MNADTVCQCDHAISEHSGFPDGAITYCLVIVEQGDPVHGDPPVFCSCGDFLEKGSDI